MNLDTPIANLPRTASRTITKLRKLGINSYYDLINYYPFRYENFSLVSDIASLQNGETVTIQGQIVSITNSFTRRGKQMQTAVVEDNTGKIEVIWYNQRYLLQLLSAGSLVSVAGTIENFGRKNFLSPKDYEILQFKDDVTCHTGRIVPIHSQTYGISAKTIREKIFYLTNNIKNAENDEIEILPDEIRKEFKLTNLKNAFIDIHFPEKEKDIEVSRARLAFDELFIRILASKLIKMAWQKEKTTQPITLTLNEKSKIDKLINSLPFRLTSAQNRAVAEILSDLQKPTPMNRFLQGDVGSGKTVVAMIAAYAVYLNKKKTLIMAPTEVLANQHYTTISKLLEKTKIKLALITGSKKTHKKKSDRKSVDIVIGTQALISKGFDMDSVGLVIVDEQHRFGVKQRAVLQEKGIKGLPHLLSMTATPIPRTVSLTLYSQLDFSYIDELPKGRKIIKSYVVPQAKRASGYKWIEDKIKKEKVQAYIICPLIEDSDSETMTSVKAASREYENLSKKIFPKLKVGLLHGKLKSKEKEKIMQDFKNKKIDILVSTSVVEVGIDVPNATIMLIEGSERFGMAQLHQLRGRVGRGDVQSYCFLFTSSKESQGHPRLKFFAKNDLGIKLSEYDMKLRGPGDLYGTKQHGYSDLKIANIMDAKTVSQAKAAVQQYLKIPKKQYAENLKFILKQTGIDQIAKN